MEKEMKSLVDIISKMREKHFIHDFEVEGDKLVCKETSETFEPGDLLIERIYRYEGDSNPDDTTIVYGITSKTGTQGMILDAYGTYANPKFAEIIKNIPVKEVDENQVCR